MLSTIHEHKTWEDVCSSSTMRTTAKKGVNPKESFDAASDEIKRILIRMCVNILMYQDECTSWGVSGELLTFSMRSPRSLEVSAVGDVCINVVLETMIPAIKSMHPGVTLLWNTKVSAARLKWVKLRVRHISPAFSNSVRTVLDEMM
jgi:hypothetical protein